MPFNRTESALTIAQEVAGRLGLRAPSSLTAGTDATGTQMLYLLNQVGNRLMTGESWNRFDRTWQFALTPGITEYDMPDDFAGFIDDTMWNRTTRLPLVGPASEQQWATITARQLGGVTFALIYKIDQDKLVLYYSPDEAQTVALGYRSRGWAQATGGGALKDKIDDDGDVVLFEPELVKAGLKLAFLEEKGFDTTAAKRDYDRQMEIALNRDKPAPTLKLTNDPGGFPLLTPGYNLPDTNSGL